VVIEESETHLDTAGTTAGVAGMNAGRGAAPQEGQEEEEAI